MYYSQNLPSPLFAKEGYFESMTKAEMGEFFWTIISEKLAYD